MTQQQAQYWQEFLRQTGRSGPAQPYECFAFVEEGNPLADVLLELVLQGKKYATCSCFATYKAAGEEPPKPGDLSLVTNSKGIAACVIRTQTVEVLPFNKVTWAEYARHEGEAELTPANTEEEHLQNWRNDHRAIFRQEGEELGFVFTDETPVVFETFELVYK